MNTPITFRYPWDCFDLSSWRDSGSIWLSFDVDSGGIQVFSCPMSLVRASEAVLLQLASDLEFVAWNKPIDPAHSTPSDEVEFYLMEKDSKASLPEFVDEKFGKFFGDYWMGHDIWDGDINQEVCDVISGRKSRIDIDKYLVNKYQKPQQ